LFSIPREAQASESDVEEGGESTVTLAQNYVGRNNKKTDQRAVSLIELGPRMKIELIKLQTGFCDGEVVYHKLGTVKPFLFSIFPLQSPFFSFLFFSFLFLSLFTLLATLFCSSTRFFPPYL